MYLRNYKYGDPIELTGYFENGTLTLYETEPNNLNLRASMQFMNFNINNDVIEGIWQDLRVGSLSNRYKIKKVLQKLV